MTTKTVFGPDGLVNSLAGSIRDGGSALKQVPALLREILETDAWKDFHTKLRTHVTHTRFIDFITMPPLDGLGVEVKLIQRLVQDDPVAADLLDRALQNPNGVHAVDNIHSTRPGGTSKDAALRRLRKDAPELHAKVLSGEMSAHAAAVAAGHRRKTFTLPTDPTGIAATLRRRLSPADLAEVLRLLEHTA